ncbi:MAG: 16S rRNA (cytidine(1402)-2'-O)-methyltransferase [Verrucomicrobiae bacterium]|nr:16S rRNA (cytidine(1402)-2'-O)-methyltransferase [Verrucomicrobiae bacterium]
MSQHGKLFLVATPIGNLEDISLRALRVLREVDCIAAEDTRRTAMLLAHYDIRKPLLSYHQFNEARRVAPLLEKLRTGRSVALVSDAGMPTISDPGRRLLCAALEAGLPVEVVPGPSAVTAAIALSGLPAEPFLFYGFLPHRETERRRVLKGLALLPYTLIFFESPHRLLRSLANMHEVLGDRHVVLARELTKKFEEVLRGKISSLRKALENRSLKGEITLLVEGLSSQ